MLWMIVTPEQNPVQLDIRKNVITSYDSIEFTNIYESVIEFEYKRTEYQKCKK